TLKVDGRVVAAGNIETSPEHDYVGGLDLVTSDTMPDQAFTVEVAGVERSGVYAQSKDGAKEFTFIMGSCNQPYMRQGEEAVPSPTGEIYVPMLEVARDSGARFSLFMGDQAYADGIQGLSVPEWAREYPEVSDG